MEEIETERSRTFIMISNGKDVMASDPIQGDVLITVPYNLYMEGHEESSIDEMVESTRSILSSLRGTKKRITLIISTDMVNEDEMISCAYGIANEINDRIEEIKDKHNDSAAEFIIGKQSHRKVFGDILSLHMRNGEKWKEVSESYRVAVLRDFRKNELIIAGMDPLKAAGKALEEYQKTPAPEEEIIVAAE